MDTTLEFFFGCMDLFDSPRFAADEFQGKNGPALELLRSLGFIGQRVPDPMPLCTWCREGGPYEIAGRLICNGCASPFREEDLYLWPVEVERLLAWFSAAQGFSGRVVQIEPECWQLGTLPGGRMPRPCFFLRGNGPSQMARRRMIGSPVLLWAGLEVHEVPGIGGKGFLLSSLVRREGSRLAVYSLSDVLERGGAVRLTEAGEIFAGETLLGSVPPGTREYWFLDALFQRRDRPVPYEEIQDHVRDNNRGFKDQSAGRVFCHKLRNRLKTVYGIRHLDRLVLSGTYPGCYLMPSTLSLGIVAG